MTCHVTTFFHDCDCAAYALRRLQQQGFGQSELAVVSSVDPEVHQDLTERLARVDAHCGAGADIVSGGELKRALVEV